jgi:hypothetical protein
MIRQLVYPTSLQMQKVGPAGPTFDVSIAGILSLGQVLV